MFGHFILSIRLVTLISFGCFRCGCRVCSLKYFVVWLFSMSLSCALSEIFRGLVVFDVVVVCAL
jgi:hypothetical protein